MKAKKMSLILCILILLVTGIAGCGKEQPQEAEYNIFYINKEKTKIVPVPYEPESEKDETMISDLILKLSQDPGSVDYRSPLAGNAGIMSWSLESGQLQLNFGSEYLQMDKITEVLCRAAVVRTLIQVKGVDYISFYVGDAPLVDENGNPIGLMTAESFIENPGEQINSIQTATITLYFSNKQGDALVQEVQERHYNSNISLEKLVMEQLIKDPISVDGMSAIPGGTKLVSVSVLDGVCFVNLDEGFLNQNYEINEDIVIYSIVDSLAELPNVNKVQISVNGDTSITYREKYSLGTVYERNLDFLETSKEEEGQSEETEEGQEGDTGE